MRSILSIAAGFGAFGALVFGLGMASLLGSAGAPVWLWLPAALITGLAGGFGGMIATLVLPVPKPPSPPQSLAGAIAEIEALAVDREEALTRGDEAGGPPDLLAAVRATATALAEERALVQVRQRELTTTLERAKDSAKLIKRRLDEADDRNEDLLSVQEAFLSRMSHELRTPLNAISGYVELLLEDVDGSAAADLQKIRLASLNLAALVTGVLDLTELQSGSYAVRPEPVPLERLVADVVESVRLTADSQRTRVDVEVEPRLAAVLDKRMIRSVLFNLVSNACKYTTAGVVRVVVRGKAGGMAAGGERAGEPCIVLEVIDTGIGMTERQIEAAFRPFTQADVSSTRRYDGSGVGLAVVRGFVEAMGGTLHIESQPGKGAHVSVLLPAVAFPREAKLVGDEEVTMLLR